MKPSPLTTGVDVNDECKYDLAAVIGPQLSAAATGESIDGTGGRLRRLSAAMENTSLMSGAWDTVTTSSSLELDDLTRYIVHISNVELKVIYILIGTIGVLDNLFVIVVFALFIKITDKVLTILTLSPPITLRLYTLPY